MARNKKKIKNFLRKTSLKAVKTVSNALKTKYIHQKFDMQALFNRAR